MNGQRRIINNLSEFTFSEWPEYLHHSTQLSSNKILVKDCDINFDLRISKTYGSVEFIRCNFLKPFSCSQLTVKRNFDFTGCKFIDVCTFENIVIEGKSRFWQSEFTKNFTLNNVRFSDLADFFKVQFSEVIIFYKVDFFGTTVFTEATFNKNVLFTYTKITDVIIFTRTSFHKGLDLSLAIITGKITIHSSDLKNFEDVPDIEDNSLYRTAVETAGIITRSNQRETYRILKKFSKEDENQFKVLEYSKLENEVYFKQLKTSILPRFDNFIIFLLNKYSNDHNKSWSRGILFTSIVGFIFFYSSLISTSCVVSSIYFPNWQVFEHYLGMYFNFLSPLHTLDLFTLEHPNSGTIILDFLGRVFVGYGIYQTVQAFRKHKG